MFDRTGPKYDRSGSSRGRAPAVKRPDRSDFPPRLIAKLTKGQETRIQELIRQVHEKRVGDSLALVEQALADWRAGALATLKVDDAMRKHLQLSTRYFARYANTAARDMEAISIVEEAKDLGFLNDEEFRGLTRIESVPKFPPRPPRP